MDRQGISSPVFDIDGANKDIHEKTIGLQREMQACLGNIAIEQRHFQTRTMASFDDLCDSFNKQMAELRHLVVDYKSSSPSSSSRRRRSSHKSSERKHDASASLPRPHRHGDHRHRHEGQVTSKHHVHDDDERHLLRAQARQRHHHHEDARQEQTHKSQQALLHAKSKLHEHKRRPRDEHHQDRATATPTTSASSPSAIKASSPLDVRHLRLLPVSFSTSTSSSTR